jgi:methionyl-tRNA formyltransferase
MLPEIVWNMPPMGTFNLHGSLLPKYRGAAPINWAIIKGEKETGLTTFFLQHAIDTGDILLQDKIEVGENDSAGEIHDRMKMVGAELVLKTIQMIEKGGYQTTPQASVEDSHAPKIFENTCLIDFSKTAQEVHNFVRGLSPYPTAFSHLNELKFKIFQTEKEIIPHDLPTGSLVSDNKHFLKIAVSDGFIHCLDVQLEGRKRMDIKTFLNGHKITT